MMNKTKFKKICLQLLKQERLARGLTMQEMIQPTTGCQLPEHQKYICSSRTLVQMENGETKHKEMIMINLAIRVQRSYHYDECLNQQLDLISQLMIDYLKQPSPRKKSLIYYQLNHFNTNNALYYQEMKALLEHCAAFICDLKPLNLDLFKNLPLFIDLLDDQLQLIFDFVLATYHLYYECDATLTFYFINKHTSYSTDFNKNILSRYELLSKIFNLSTKFYQDKHSRGGYLAGLAFLYASQEMYEKAYIYFREANKIHPVFTLKYLPAFYLTIQHTQPSMLRFHLYLQTLPNIKNGYLQSLITYFQIENPQKQRIYIKNHILNHLKKDVHSYYYSYLCNFFYERLLKN